MASRGFRPSSEWCTLPSCRRDSKGYYDVSEDVSVERLSVAEAAEALGVTRDAIHKRINRNKIEYEKGEDGRFYVFVDTSTEGLDSSTDKSKDESKVEALERLVRAHEDRIASLERQLERKGDDTAELHRIIAGLTQANARLASRVPELEAPQEPTEDAETVEEEPEDTEPRPGTPSPQEGTRRPQGGGLRRLRRHLLGW
jgi:DNA-binding transcriptional MerR regulator